MDIVVLYGLTNAISPDLQEVIREHVRTTRHLWLGLQNQFFGNRETHTLHLDIVFRNFVQGDLSVSEYCRKSKGMVDALADLGLLVDDQILVLNILHGLNQCFEHVGAIIRCFSLFLNFLKVRDDLLLEEIHLDTSGPTVAPTMFYSNNTPHAPQPLPSAPLRPPDKSNDNTKNRRNSGNVKVKSMDFDNILGPFYLNNILLAPDIVQSLLSICHFTTDNWCSMEFDLLFYL
jgi:hypothetical protein